MKYFNNYNSYHKINEGNDWNVKNSTVGGWFIKLGRSISIGVKRTRLSLIANNYDKYLGSVYKEYLFKEEFGVSKEDMKNIDMEEITPLIKAELPKEIEEDEIETPVIIQMDKDAINVELEKDNNSNSDKIKKSFKIKNIKVDGENVDLTDYKINIDKWNALSPENQEEVKHNILNAKQQEDVIKRMENTRDDIIDKIDELEAELKKFKDLITKTSGTVRAERQNKINDISLELEKLYNERDKYEDGIADLYDELKDFRENGIFKVINLNEKNSYVDPNTETDTETYMWNDEDTMAVTKMANPYTIEGFFMKADYIVSGTEKNGQLKRLWDIKVNKVHEKWYYVYDIENLRTKTKKLTTSKSDSDKKKDSAKVKELLEISFDKYLRVYSSPVFTRIEKETASYYLFSLDSSKMLFLKKEEFINNDHKYIFKIIGEVSVDIKGNMYLSSDYSKTEVDIINYNNRTLELYVDTQDGYPVVFFNRNNMYSFDTLEDNIKSIDLVSFNISGIDTEMDKKIINHNNSFNFDTKDIEENVMEKIKKEYL